MIQFAVVGLALIGLAMPLVGGEFNKVLSIGDAAPNFTDLPGVDDKNHSLSEFKKDVVVIVVTCNHCPIAIGYEERIIAFTKKYSDKVDVVAINVSNFDQDKLPAMKERAREKGFNFPYLSDASQKVGKAYGATVTPEFYVLGKDRKIAYMGAMDDHNTATKAKVSYLESAVEAALKGGKLEKAETKARGCSVQYD